MYTNIFRRWSCVFIFSNITKKKSSVYRSNDMITTNFWINSTDRRYYVFCDLVRWRESAMCFVHTMISNEPINWPSWVLLLIRSIVFFVWRLDNSVCPLNVSIEFNFISRLDLLHQINQTINRFKNKITGEQNSQTSVECFWEIIDTQNNMNWSMFDRKLF